jgi:hypothetical protein
MVAQAHMEGLLQRCGVPGRLRPHDSVGRGHQGGEIEKLRDADTHRRWFAFGVAKHRDLGWVVPFLLWLGLTIRLITWYIPSGSITKPVRIAWNKSAQLVLDVVPERWRLPLGGLFALVVVLIATFVPPETAYNTRRDRAVSLFGLVVALAGLYATSRDRSKVKFQTVIVGVLAQFILGLFVLRTQVGVSMAEKARAEDKKTS